MVCDMINAQSLVSRSFLHLVLLNSTESSHLTPDVTTSGNSSEMSITEDIWVNKRSGSPSLYL
jgi:hypothetical protein